jgi:hypothetical protein
MSGTLLHSTSRSRVARERSVTVAAERQPRGLRAPLALALSFAVAAPLSIAFAVVDGAGHPALAASLLGVAAFAVACTVDLAGSVLVGLVFWLFLDGFDVNRWGVLGWDGHADALRLGLLVAAGILGSVVGLLAAHLPSRR